MLEIDINYHVTTNGVRVQIAVVPSYSAVQ